MLRGLATRVTFAVFLLARLSFWLFLQMEMKCQATFAKETNERITNVKMLNYNDEHVHFLLS